MDAAHELAQAYHSNGDHSVMFDEPSPTNNNNQWNNRGSVDDEGVHFYNDGMDSQGGSGARGRYASPKYTRQSMDDSLIATDARTNRVLNAEAAMRQEIYKECTFRPNIKDLPSHYGAKKDLNVPFQTRVSKWQKEKDLALETKAKELENSEKAACTFHPKISANSYKAVKEIRGADFNDNASQRLYKNSELSMQQRAQVINEIKQKEEEALLEQCTFKPHLKTKDASVHQSVQSKFTLPLQRKDDSQPTELKNCTFTPKVNKIKHTMSSAKLYCSTDVVERLSRPPGSNNNPSNTSAADDIPTQYFDAQSAANERPIMDMNSFMASLSGQPANAKGAGFDTPGKPGSDRSGTPSGKGDKAKRDAKFEMFLARQQANLKKREESVKQIARSTTPNFKPQLARRPSSQQKPKASAKATNAAAATSGDGPATEDAGEGDASSQATATEDLDFVKRMEIEVARRRAIEQENQMTVGDPNCTFHPQINKKTENLRARSIFEMSVADHQRKENNRRALKLEAEQNELVNMTFQPKLSKFAASKGKSVLQLSADNTQFLEWLKQNNLKKEQKRLEIMREREEAETKDCTFSPKTTECPAYVKRIALSMSIVKAARNNTSSVLDSEDSKPEWR